MTIYDIAQEVLSCKVYPGDPAPAVQQLAVIGEQGSVYNGTSFSMCSHNGTHVDAPAHFIKDGKTIGEIPVETFIGDCYVARHSGEVTADDVRSMLARAAAAGAGERLLIAGPAVLTEGAARVLVEEKLLLYGNESQTVGPENAPMAVHLILLGAGIVLLEGAVLTDVPEGKYLLNAAPLNLARCEGAPCRAVLLAE